MELLPPTVMSKDDYVFIETIGKGQYGEVKLARNKATGEFFACKSVKKGDGKVSGMTSFQIQSEMISMSHVNGHPYILRFMDHLEEDERIHIVTELCIHGDLFDFVSRNGLLKERIASNIILQVAMALQYCHIKNLVHRDVKPENILIADWNKDPSTGACYPSVRLADFGSATILKPGGTTFGCRGTFMYMAPEMIRREEYSFPADVWSLGILMFTCLTGNYPFHGETKQEIAEAICYDDITSHSHEWKDLSPLAIDLICWMLQSDPCKRASMRDVMNHPWVLQYSFLQSDEEEEEEEDLCDMDIDTNALASCQTPGCFYPISFLSRWGKS